MQNYYQKVKVKVSADTKALHKIIHSLFFSNSFLLPVTSEGLTIQVCLNMTYK